MVSASVGGLIVVVRLHFFRVKLVAALHMPPRRRVQHYSQAWNLEHGVEGPGAAQQAVGKQQRGAVRFGPGHVRIPRGTRV